MTRKERMEALIHGRNYDRPPFNFYEITAIDQKPRPGDPFCIYNDPSWAPVVQLAWEKSDIILLRPPVFHMEEPLTNKKPIYTEHTETHIDEKGSRWTTYTLEIDGHTLRRVERRDPDVDTIWTIEHLLKDEDDLEAWMKLPDREIAEIDDTGFFHDEALLGDRGIVALDWGDTLGTLAGLFSMEDFTITAMTCQDLFQEALDKVHRTLVKQYKAAAHHFPNRMWRLWGPEYAGVPYLPPYLYDRYVVPYDTEASAICRESGGVPRYHQHGHLSQNLASMIKMGAWGIDPVEPPSQGDVTLKQVRDTYGDQLVLFGNLEASDIETLSPDEFAVKVNTALDEGMDGGRFVLQASASPYGRHFSETALNNYRRWVQIMEERFPGTL